MKFWYLSQVNDIPLASVAHFSSFFPQILVVWSSINKSNKMCPLNINILTWHEVKNTAAQRHCEVSLALLNAVVFRVGPVKPELPFKRKIAISLAQRHFRYWFGWSAHLRLHRNEIFCHRSNRKAKTWQLGCFHWAVQQHLPKKSGC